MAKTIKFNLNLDGYPVRNLEGLQEHFSIEDILEYYNNGMLSRWLRTRGFSDQLEKVEKINPNEGLHSIIQGLIEAFEMDVENEEIEKIEKHLLSESKKLEKQEVNTSNLNSDYNRLLNHMEMNKDDLKALDSDIEELEKRFLSIFSLDYRNVYFRLLISAPKAIYLILANPKLSKYWIESNDLELKESIQVNILYRDKLKEIWKGKLIILSKFTCNQWECYHPNWVNILILRLDCGVLIRNAGKTSEKFSYHDITDKGICMKLKGMDFLTSSGYLDIYYILL